MKRLDLPEALSALPNRIKGAGIEVCLLDSTFEQERQFSVKLHLHTLLIALDGALTIHCNNTQETLKQHEAIMIKKNCSVSLEISDESSEQFRCMLIFFDEPALRYALMPFETSPQLVPQEFLKIPINEKIKVFTDSILLYYKSFHSHQNWAVLLQNKLRELIWIFFHTEIKEEAKSFFSSSRNR